MAKNLTSNISDRKTELKLLLRFVNHATENEDDGALNKKILDHLCQHPALHKDNRIFKNEKNLSDFIGTLKRHFRFRLKDIIKNKFNISEMPLWQIGGYIHFSLNPIQNCFQEHFKLRKTKIGSEINAFKKILDIWLIEIIQELDFTPRRFGKCERCGAFFYNPTKKERTYCSTRCSNAMRQENFRKKRREKK